jgi:hypothetical protein
MTLREHLLGLAALWWHNSSTAKDRWSPRWRWDGDDQSLLRASRVVERCEARAIVGDQNGLVALCEIPQGFTRFGSVASASLGMNVVVAARAGRLPMVAMLATRSRECGSAVMRSRFQRLPIKSKASARRAARSRNLPRTTEFDIMLGVFMPRIRIQRCSPLPTTNTSSLPVTRWISSAIWCVNRSCNCSRWANWWAILANLDSLSTFSVAI